MKEKLLIVAHHLTVGGVQKTLISALKAIDYDKYDVTLYLRKNRTDLLPLIDKRVKVIINDDTHHYYRKPYALWLQLLIMLSRGFKNNKKADYYAEILKDKIRWYGMEYEYKTYFKDKTFDKAIAYVQGYAAQLVGEYVTAKQKYVFFHSSTDELREVHKRVITKFQKVVSLHEAQKELIKKWYPEIADRIVLVENYIDKEMVSAQSLEYAVEKPEGKTMLCSCGRFAAVKGFDLAVKCAKILKEKGLSFIWYFVGDGPERMKIEKLISDYDLQDEIVITGMKKNPYPYMKACDIYVQPSYEEAMPLTIIEAQRLNKIVVSTKTVGGCNLIDDGENGMLCDISGQAISEVIEQLIENKALYNKIKQNLENTDHTKEFEKYKKQWSELLKG